MSNTSLIDHDEPNVETPELPNSPKKFQVVKAADVAIATNEKFSGISYAGSGGSADVWYAIPQAALGNINPSEDPTKTVAEVRRHMCAVKFFKESPKGAAAAVRSCAKEVAIIMRVRATAGPLQGRFPELIQYQYAKHVPGSTSVADWYAMKAIPSCNLMHLCHSALARNRTIPPELVYHAYIQLSEAVHFLHTSTPRILKGNLLAVNVMIDPTTPDIPGFPNFKLIEFGDARLDPTERSLAWEMYFFYAIMYTTALLGHKCALTDGGEANVGELPDASVMTVKTMLRLADSDDEIKDAGPPACVHDTAFNDFVDVLKTGAKNAFQQNPNWSAVDEELQNRIPTLLKIKRDCASEETIKAINDLIDETVKLVVAGFPTDQQILDALPKS